MAMPARYYLDTNVIISIIDGARGLDKEQAEFIAHVDEGRIEALTSELTLAECLVRPFANENTPLIKTYMRFLESRSNFPVIPVSRDILISAAQLRVEARLKLPDAIHAATARISDCTVFLTCDRRIKDFRGLRVLLWDRLGNSNHE